MRTTQVAKFLGVTERQLQTWDETAIVTVPRILNGVCGCPRDYGTAELFHVGIVAALRRQEMSLQRIRTILNRLPTRRTVGYLVTDGERTRYAVTPQRAIELGARFPGAIRIVDLGALREKIERAVKRNGQR